MQINEGPNLPSCPLFALFVGYFTLTITFHKQRSRLHLKERAGVQAQEMDSMVLVGLLQLRMFFDSMRSKVTGWDQTKQKGKRPGEETGVN